MEWNEAKLAKPELEREIDGELESWRRRRTATSWG